MKYKLVQAILPNNFKIDGIQIIREDGSIYGFIKDPANTDYANFKREILAGTAQLEDVDGNVMTAEAAQAFVQTLP